MAKNTLETFWSRVEKTDSCWNWRGVKDRDGYGKFKMTPYEGSAHRFSYMQKHGPIPPGQHVCHTCDNPACVNPDHLWLGTTQANTQDKVNKNRQARGSQTNITKLTEDQVREIRASKLSASKTAKLYNVTKYCIDAVRQRKTWKHI